MQITIQIYAKNSVLPIHLLIMKQGYVLQNVQLMKTSMVILSFMSVHIPVQKVMGVKYLKNASLNAMMIIGVIH